MNVTSSQNEQNSQTVRWLRRIRYVLWGCVVLLLTLIAGWWQTDGPGQSITTTKSGLGTLASGFQMTTHTGAPFTYKTVTTKPTLMFFGFLNCPDVCPTTLSDMSDWIEALGNDADRLKFVFVSVDPERDTREAMESYLSSFDKRITGVVGPLNELRKLTKPLGIYFEKVPQGDTYTMNHTASALILDRSGAIRTLVDYHEKRDIAVKKIRRILRTSG